MEAKWKKEMHLVASDSVDPLQVYPSVWEHSFKEYVPGNYKSPSRLSPQRGERRHGVGGGPSGRKQLLELKCFKCHTASYDRPRGLQASGQLSRTSVTVWAVQQRTRALRSTGHGPHNDGGAAPHCPGDLSPPLSASASGWTPRSSAPVSGSRGLSASAAPVERDALSVGLEHFDFVAEDNCCLHWICATCRSAGDWRPRRPLLLCGYFLETAQFIL